MPMSQPNVLWRRGVRPFVRGLEIIFQDEFTDSFEGFTTSWRENCVFSFSPSAANTVRENLSLFDNQDYVEFIEWILEYVGSNFLPFRFGLLIEKGYADDEFFDIILSIMDYLKDAFETIAKALNVDTSAQEYENTFGSVDLVTHLIKKSSEVLFDLYDDRIMKTICKRVRFLRKSHSYHDSVFWNSLSRTSLAKVAEVLNRVPETERYAEFVRQYESELVSDIRKYVKRIPLAISEKRFLLMMRECVDMEETVYNTLISPDVEVYGECNTKILDMFRHQHEKRRAASIFKNMDSELVNPEAKFSPEYFRDIYALYIFRGDEASIVNLRKLSSIIQESFVQIVQKHSARLGEDLPGPQSLEYFRVALEELFKHNKLIKARLSQISDNEVLLKALESASSQLSLSRLSTMGYAHLIHSANEYAINFLCNRNMKSNDELASLSLIVNYYLFIPQHARFMDDLYLKMKMTALQRIQLPMDRLNNFTNWSHVNGKVSKKVECLIQDLNASFGIGGNDETAFVDASSDLKCDTCLMIRSRYWGSVKDLSKLLRPWPQMARIQERVTAHLERKIDKHRQLIPMHCMSRVVLKTSLYTGGRKFTTLDMLQYQSMVLILCEQKEPIRMSEILGSLCVERFETEQDRKRAEKFVGLLVDSLLRPYPLLQTTQSIASNPHDAVLSINHAFAFQEDKVRLPGDHLLLSEEVSL